MYQILEEIPLFDGVKQSILETISKDFSIKKYKRNRPILVENGRNEHFYIIKKGVARVFRTDKSGQKVILAILQEGDFFGEMSILDECPVSANISTTQPSELLCISDRKFKRLLKTVPKFSERLFQQMSQRIRNCDESIENLNKPNSYERVGFVLLNLAERCGYRRKASVIIDKLPFQHNIASLAGTSRETVSRTFSRLEEKDYIIKAGRHLEIRDYPRFYEEFSK